MAQIPVQTKENYIFLPSHSLSTQRKVTFRRHYLSVRLFLCLVFAIGFIITTDFLWHRLNHTKLGSIVKLDVGKIQGVYWTESGVEVEHFIGVPFAEPPTGSNRFEKTVPVKPWSGVKETIVVKPHCFPLIYDSPSGFSEDCLYLNIARPRNRSNELLPVLFSVHGGAFEFGGADLYGLSATRGLNLLKNDVILVAIQYRLAIFGFASTGEKDLPGNLGYFDQAEALKFIHRNIKFFGGDPDRITILGCSAGGASVTALSISPYTRDYVHQAIAYSGSAFSAWATSDVVIDSTKELVQILGQKTDETVKDRLKRATAAEINKVIKQTGSTHFGENFGVFMPRIDGDFFSKDLPDLIEEAPKKAIVIGLTSEESLAWTLIGSRNGTSTALVIPVSERADFSYKNLEGLIKNHLVVDKYFGAKTEEVQKKVLDFYSKSNSNDKDNIFYLQRYTQILSDLQFNVPVLWEILLRGYHGWTVFAYNSPHYSYNTIPSICPVKESYHGSDQHYAPIVLGYNSIFDDEDDVKMEVQTIKWLINFVKTGNPSTPDFEWAPTTRNSSLQYALLNPTPQSKAGFFGDRAKFWTQLTKDYDYDLVRMMPKKKDLNV